MESVELEEKNLEFLIKDYELKIKYLTDHFSRMWMRFNFFLTIQSALSVALFSLFKETETLSTYGIYIALFGTVSSLCWYIFGAQDKYLSVIYREHIEDTAAQLGKILGLQKYLEADYIDVSNLRTRKKIKQNIYQWRYASISTTKLAALFPLVVFVYWVFIIILLSR